VQDSYAGLVRGPSSTLPRGYLVLIPVWCAVACAAVIVLCARLSSGLIWWYAPFALGGLLIAAGTLAVVLATARRVAFQVDGGGIWLGRPTDRKRPKRRIARIWWRDVQQVNIFPKRYGVLLEVMVSPAGLAGYKHRPMLRGLLLCCMLIVPVGLGRSTPGLTAPRLIGAGPGWYLIPLCDVTPDRLRQVLTRLVPQTLPVSVRTGRGKVISSPGTTTGRGRSISGQESVLAGEGTASGAT
jgi:hypothetical protein